MDDLIVIILTLIVVVVGAIGQIKRKPQPQPEGEGELEKQKPSGGFWDFLEGLDEKSQQKNQIETAEEEQITTEPIKQEEYNFSAQNEGADIRSEITSNNKTESTNNVKEENKKIIKSFSLKKAVIYSEILNRKYN